MTIPPLLDELLRAHGASGHEDAVQAIVRREAAAIGAEVERDVLGSTIATVRGTAGGRTIALFAHADQVGMAVRDAGEDGLLTLRSSRPGVTPMRSGSASGSTRAAARSAASSSRRGTASRRGRRLRVDIGAAGREDALGLVRPGDVIVLDGPPDAAAERTCALGRPGRSHRDLRRPRGPRAGGRRPARVGRCARRLGAGGDGNPRRRSARGRAARPRRRDCRRGHVRGRRSRGRTLGRRAARRRADRLPRAGRQPDRRGRPARGGGRGRDRRARSSPGRRRTATPTTSSLPAPGSPAGSSASRCGTCTPPARSSSSPTSRPRPG